MGFTGYLSGRENSDEGEHRMQKLARIERLKQMNCRVGNAESDFLQLIQVELEKRTTSSISGR